MNLPAHAPKFTAARLAAALGLTKRAVQLALARTEPAGTVAVAGNLAPAWVFAQLPEAYQGRLVVAARRRGFRDPVALLGDSPEPWHPPVPLSALPAGAVEKARRLQRALLPVFAKENEPGLSAAALNEFALQCYRGEFGFTVSARHWLRLYLRTKERDAGREEWERLELYVDERAVAVIATPPAAPVRSDFNHSLALGAEVLRFNALNAATLGDRAALFHAAFQHLETLLQAPGNASERAAKASLVGYLASACPTLTQPPGAREALRRTVDRKLARWREGGRLLTALDDQRPASSGNHRQQDFTADVQKVRDAAVLFDGNESLAYRKLHLAGELSEEFRAAYPLNTRKDKSRVPAFVRASVTPEVEAVLPLKRGPHQARKAGPWIARDWSGVAPADWWVADDVTWNSYYYEPDGRGGFDLHRGECLLGTDLRTAYPLGFLLISGRYNSEHIRRLILEIHDDPCLGLPHRGFYFENSIWGSALVAGLESSALPFHEFTRGVELPGIGLQVRHATPGNPRSKPIERTIGILQEKMRNEPGFVGFNERDDRRERMQDFLARVRAGKEHPGNELLSRDAWSERIAALLQEFAGEPQNGQMLPGQSPAEAWRAGLANRPLRRLAPEQRFILSTHCQRVTVSARDGIRLRIRGQTRRYLGEATGPFIGREVLAFYNLDAPELLTISDLDRTRYAAVPEFKPLPAMDATPDEFATAHEQAAGHTAHTRALWKGVRHQVGASVTRDRLHDDATRELGAFHAATTAEHLSDREAKTTERRKADRVAQKFGNRAARNPERVLAAKDDGFAALSQLRAETARDLTPTPTP